MWSDLCSFFFEQKELMKILLLEKIGRIGENFEEKRR
ncbi:unnamed protein product [Arabidopsis lyrata]|uniref:Uncharacterized protein n=1 Tax=Arabidopsis thaliana x Arabidopsis arenosa TaxID=1240361 RepID=A0A8T1ZKJ5_9BRAS|nr:hypothetical protein ISN45_Aa05g003920 [Arabidopsis thaliana x Arabidopsis arenosa]CAH8266757.1 unnamed protein product [Arabidopsis lyrata]